MHTNVSEEPAASIFRIYRNFHTHSYLSFDSDVMKTLRFQNIDTSSYLIMMSFFFFGRVSVLRKVAEALSGTVRGKQRNFFFRVRSVNRNDKFADLTLDNRQFRKQ
jgi:hypothetical protein